MESESMKILGIWFDNKLNFKKQIDHVSNKMKSAISALIKTKHTLNFRSKIQIYNGLVKPHIDYCCLVWLDKANKGQLNKLHMLQKRAIRLCFNAAYNTHSAQLFRISNTIPLDQIYSRESVIFIKKHQNGELPKVFSDKLGNFQTEVRAKFQYSIKIPTSHKCGQMFYNIISQWNKADQGLRKPSKTEVTKTKTKEAIIDNLNTIKCSKKQCFMCLRDSSKNFEKYAQL